MLVSLGPFTGSSIATVMLRIFISQLVWLVNIMSDHFAFYFVYVSSRWLTPSLVVIVTEAKWPQAIGLYIQTAVKLTWGLFGPPGDLVLNWKMMRASEKS